MGINTERDIEANLQIGPTDQGMVRIFIAAGDLEVPMDFEPDEAEEIADEWECATADASLGWALTQTGGRQRYQLCTSLGSDMRMTYMMASRSMRSHEHG